MHNSPQESVVYLRQKVSPKKKKNQENRESFCPQKFLPEHTYVNVNVTVPIGFQCCFEMTLTLSTQNTESAKANVMSSFI